MKDTVVRSTVVVLIIRLKYSSFTTFLQKIKNKSLNYCADVSPTECFFKTGPALGWVHLLCPTSWV